MAERTKINAVEMVRRIRHEQARLLAGKPLAEIIAFYREAGQEVRKLMRATETDCIYRFAGCQQVLSADHPLLHADLLKSLSIPALQFLRLHSDIHFL